MPLADLVPQPARDLYARFPLVTLPPSFSPYRAPAPSAPQLWVRRRPPPPRRRRLARAHTPSRTPMRTDRAPGKQQRRVELAPAQPARAAAAAARARARRRVEGLGERGQRAGRCVPLAFGPGSSFALLLGAVRSTPDLCPTRWVASRRLVATLPALYLPDGGLLAADAIRPWLDQTHALYPADAPSVPSSHMALARLALRHADRRPPANPKGTTATRPRRSSSKRAPSAGSSTRPSTQRSSRLSLHPHTCRSSRSSCRHPHHGGQAWRPRSRWPRGARAAGGLTSARSRARAQRPSGRSRRGSRRTATARDGCLGARACCFFRLRLIQTLGSALADEVCLLVPHERLLTPALPLCTPQRADGARLPGRRPPARHLDRAPADEHAPAGGRGRARPAGVHAPADGPARGADGGGRREGHAIEHDPLRGTSARGRAKSSRGKAHFRSPPPSVRPLPPRSRSYSEASSVLAQRARCWSSSRPLAQRSCASTALVVRSASSRISMTCGAQGCQGQHLLAPSRGGSHALGRASC